MSTHGNGSHDERDLLVQALRDQSSHVHGHPLGLADVKGRARSIRRRRTAVRGVVAAMVAAVVVPSGLALTDALDSPGGNRPDVVATPTPSPKESVSTDAASPAPDGERHRLTITGLPEGAPADLGYIVPGTRQLVLPGGRAREIPEAYSQIVEYGDGWLALAAQDDADGGMSVAFLDHDFNEHMSEDSLGYRIVLDDDRTQVAYSVVDNVGQNLLVSAPVDGTDPVTWTMPDKVQSIDPTAYLGGGALAYEVTYKNGEIESGVAEPGGTLSTPDVRRIDGGSDTANLTAALLSYDNTTGGCSGVLDSGNLDGTPVWQSCDYKVTDFSPNGQLVIAYPASYDGPGPTSLYVLDAQTGDLVTEFSPEKGGRTVVGVMQAAWEDDDSILAIVEEGTEQRMVRANLDGTLEAVTDPVPVTDMSVKLWFADVPR